MPARSDTGSDDDEAVWLVAEAEQQPEWGLANPFRSQAALKQAREVRVAKLVRAARGPQLFGLVDWKVLFWVLSHVLAPVALYGVDADFRYLLAAALLGRTDPAQPSRAACAAKLVAYGVLQAAVFALLRRMYCSDPGWIALSAPAVDPPPHAPACPLCGEQPSRRSHHDKHTGQCVHKHDHHCWFLSATIGDRNHAGFVSLLAVDCTLLIWLQLRIGWLSLQCHPFWAWGDVVAGRSLWLRHPCPGVLRAWQLWVLWSLSVFGLVWLCMLLHLLVLHMYLMATNQTTLELLKGPRLPYLHPFFPHAEGACSRSVADRGGVSILVLAARHWKGTAPPRPFDQGLRENLRLFWLAPKPYPYRYNAKIQD